MRGQLRPSWRKVGGRERFKRKVRQENRRTKEEKTAKATATGVTKKDARENATREDPEESGKELSRRCCLLLISHAYHSFLFSFPPLPVRPAALFMTLSTSLATVFLRHYTWKNSGPGKLDIVTRVHAARCYVERARDALFLCILSAKSRIEKQIVVAKTR